ncbi:MAG: DUF4114 domain-containing protein [Nevskiales bacterium]|nr:DUF4114 domain-containing protein [Nevskiales bacterium]
MIRSARVREMAFFAGLVCLPAVTDAAVCTFGPGTPPEPTLQDVMDQRLSFAPDADTDCVTDGADAYWTLSGTTGWISLSAEIAGNAGINTLGIYDPTNPDNRLELFSGTARPFFTRKVTITPAEEGFLYEIRRWINDDLLASGIFGSDSFGFYLTTPDGIFYSDTSLNTDSTDHLYAYQGNDATFLGNVRVPPRLQGDPFSPDMQLMAWEDLFGGGDGDYQDMVLLTRGITPVPVPGALGLFAAGLTLLGMLRGRRT